MRNGIFYEMKMAMPHNEKWNFLWNENSVALHAPIFLWSENGVALYAPIMRNGMFMRWKIKWNLYEMKNEYAYLVIDWMGNTVPTQTMNTPSLVAAHVNSYLSEDKGADLTS